MNKKYYTPLSSTLEYIVITNKSHFFGFYHMQLKFKNKNKLYDYEIKKKLWDNSLKNETIKNNGLNIGKSIWCYIILGDIIEYTDFQTIMNSN